MNGFLPREPGTAQPGGIQTILGAGGVIGNELMHELVPYATRVRLVRRYPAPPRPGMEALAADLRNAQQVRDALRDASVAYLVGGLFGNSAVWEADWPLIMDNVVQACSRNGTRLVYLDDIRLYGCTGQPMDEGTPVNPCSRKGDMRVRLAARLMDQVRAGNLCALIARAAHLYGPGATQSFVHAMVFEPLRDRRKALWLCNASVPHSLLFTPDAGRALALLGNRDDTWGQVWHLPTATPPLTGGEFITRVARAFQVAPAWRVLPASLLRIAALVSSTVRESPEWFFYYRQPYMVDSTKFSGRFFHATPYADGISTTVRCMMRADVDTL
jgi:nucleoside-diphosphate-sugar epimerase